MQKGIVVLKGTYTQTYIDRFTRLWEELLKDTPLDIRTIVIGPGEHGNDIGFLTADENSGEIKAGNIFGVSTESKPENIANLIAALYEALNVNQQKDLINKLVLKK